MPQFIGTSMTRGFAGDLTRGYYDNTTEVKVNDATAPVSAFGVPVKINSAGTGVTPVTAAADAVYGFSVRLVGQVYSSPAGQYVQSQQPVTVMRRGYMAVALESGTAALGGKVYLNATGKISADSSGNTEISNCIFMGAADADGLVEIAFNI